MSEARLLKIKSPLARQMHEPGGRTVQEAERRASLEIEVHRAPAMAAIARSLDELEALCVAAAPDAGPQVYALASRIIDVGGYFDLGPLHNAVYSLCEIADRMIGGGVWRWPSVEVHLRAARLILAEDCRPSRTTETLLNGLRAVAARIPQPGADDAAQ
jgi:hypothetical protein